jgi:hypothetical protein
MACRKYEILYTDVLDCGTWNLLEWSQVLYSYDCCMYVEGGMTAISHTIRYIMTRWALLHLTSNGVQLAGLQYVNAYSRDDLTSVEALGFDVFGQRLMFLLEKEKVLCAF